MAQINLLPWREQRREERKREFFISLGLTFALAVCLVIGMHVYFVEQIASQNNLNKLLENEILTLDRQIQEIKMLKKLKFAMIARMEVIQNLQQNRPTMVHVFDDIVKILPKGVHLSLVQRANNMITIEGYAESNANVSELMRNIDRSAWIHNPVLSKIKTDSATGKPVSSFSLHSFVSENLQSEQKSTSEEDK